MILTDTSAVIPFIRQPTGRVRKIIRSSQAAICGVTVAEVNAGGRSSQEFVRIEKALKLYQSIPIPQTIWPILGQNIATLRSQGVVIPFSDTLIATVAMENNLELWANDKHFAMIQQVMPKLKLFQEPP